MQSIMIQNSFTSHSHFIRKWNPEPKKKKKKKKKKTQYMVLLETVRVSYVRYQLTATQNNICNI